MPTLAELAGASYPETVEGAKIKPVEGRSLVPAFKSDSEMPERTIHWEHLGKKAVRRGDWKAVGARKGEWELYDLKSDPTETRDLASENPELTGELKALWQAWAERCDVIK